MRENWEERADIGMEVESVNFLSARWWLANILNGDGEDRGSDGELAQGYWAVDKGD